jgi:hypothetical protein
MGRSIGRRGVLGAAGMGAASFVIGAPAVHAQASNGVALVIGNSKYHWEAPLPNVKRDAPDIARRFQELGLKTELVQDATLDVTKKALERLAAGAKGANFAAVYFAGHGVFQKNTTALVPVDGDLSTPENLKKMPQTFHFGKATSQAAVRMLVLDACRNNPADGWRQREAVDAAMGTGPQAVSPPNPPNTKLVFSTMPGRAALDGPAGDNSPFCAALLRQFATGSIDLERLPAALRHDLMIATQGRQVMVDYGTLDRPFQLSGQASASAPRNPGNPSRVVELTGAYAQAQKTGLTILPGLLAYRPAASSADAAKIGSYSFTLGNSQPFVFAVLSVEDPKNVDVLVTMNGKVGTVWRLTYAQLAGDSLEFAASDGGARFVFKWGNAGSGTVILHPSQQASGTNALIQSGKFTRLDG